MVVTRTLVLRHKATSQEGGIKIHRKTCGSLDTVQKTSKHRENKRDAEE